MHIQAIGSQANWFAPIQRSSAIEAPSTVSPVPVVGGVSVIQSGQSTVAAINGGSLFQSIVSELMRQQALTVGGTADAQTSADFQNFLQALSQSLVPGQSASAPASNLDTPEGTRSVADQFGQNGLETGIRSLIDAMGSSQSGAQLSQLTTSFKALMSGLASNSDSASNLTLQGVLQGLLQNVQQGAQPEIGQLVDISA